MLRSVCFFTRGFVKTLTEREMKSDVVGT